MVVVGVVGGVVRPEGAVQVAVVKLRLVHLVAVCQVAVASCPRTPQPRTIQQCSLLGVWARLTRTGQASLGMLTLRESHEERGARPSRPTLYAQPTLLRYRELFATRRSGITFLGVLEEPPTSGIRLTVSCRGNDDASVYVLLNPGNLWPTRCSTASLSAFNALRPET